MIMQATVLDVQWGRLLVLDLSTRQRVVVNTPDARRFNPGDFVRIWYSGAMTNSIPPQITAQRIVLFPLPIFRPPVIIPPFFPHPGRPPIKGPGHRPPHHHR